MSAMKLAKYGTNVNRLARKYAIAHFNMFLCKVDRTGSSDFQLDKRVDNRDLRLDGDGVGASSESESEEDPSEELDLDWPRLPL
jgi:hypothetical protein